MGVKLVKKTGGSTIGEYRWAGDGDVCEVPEGLAAELTSIAPAEFSVQVDDTPEPEPAPEPEAASALVETSATKKTSSTEDTE